MEIKPFFDERTFTMTYVVYDPVSLDAVIIDPVLDYEPVGSKIWTESVDEVIKFVQDNNLNLHYVMETHAHADHLSGAQMIKETFANAKVAIGEKITVVQQTFRHFFCLGEDFAIDGSQFDRLLKDGETLEAGTLKFDVIHTPGHTPACATYKIGDAIFTGDAMFMPDMGTGRCDFPAGSATDLYKSISKLYELPEETRVFVGHDYQPGGRALAFETTIGAQKAGNVQLKGDTTEEEFVKFRSERDKTLNAPKLLFQSVQVNIDAGSMPDASPNQKQFLKIPLNVFRPEPKKEDMVIEEVAQK